MRTKRRHARAYGARPNECEFASANAFIPIGTSARSSAGQGAPRYYFGPGWCISSKPWFCTANAGVGWSTREGACAAPWGWMFHRFNAGGWSNLHEANPFAFELREEAKCGAVTGGAP